MVIKILIRHFQNVVTPYSNTKTESYHVLGVSAFKLHLGNGRHSKRRYYTSPRLKHRTIKIWYVQKKYQKNRTSYFNVEKE